MSEKICGEKICFLKLKKWPFQKVGKWYKTPNSSEIFQFLSLVVDQHKSKGHMEVKFSENAITLSWIVLEALNWCQKKQNQKVFICSKKTFCPILFKKMKILSKMVF